MAMQIDPPNLNQSTTDLVIQFLDVGQGDGIYIEFPAEAGKPPVNMLVDLGSTKNRGVVTSDMTKYFQEHTRLGPSGKTLDYLYLTHGDSDHYNMVNNFIKTLQINKVEYLMFGGPPTDYSNSLSIMQYFRQEYLSKGTIHFTFSNFPSDLAGDFGGVTVSCLACNATGPSPTRNGATKNADSMVLQLNYNGVKVILAGDATTATEKWILKRASTDDLKSAVLKVGHHGSDTSSSAEWIKAVQPSFVFISSDRHGTRDEFEHTGYGLPKEVVLDTIRLQTTLYQCELHSYISNYEPKSYGQAHQNEKKQRGYTAGWNMVRTREAIFTTLVSMENNKPDQGCQYELRITKNGGINVYSTLDFSKTSQLMASAASADASSGKK